MVNKYKAELDIDAEKLKAIQSGDPLQLVKVGIWKPEDMLMFQALGGQGQPQTQRVDVPVPTAASIGVQGGMFAPEPETPGASVTFPLSLTMPDVKQGDGFQFDMNQFLRRKFYGSGDPDEVVRTTTGANPQGQNMNYNVTRSGKLVETVPVAGKFAWVQQPNPNGPQYVPLMVQEDQYGTPTGKWRYADNPLQVYETTDASGATRRVKEPTYQQPRGGGQPSLNMGGVSGGPIAIELDPSTLTAKDVDTLASNLKKQIPQLSPRPSGGGNVTKPGPMDLPIDDKELPYWINPVTMETPPVGTSAMQAQAQGFKRVTTGARDTIASGRQALGVLTDLAPLMETVFGPASEAAQRTGAWERAVGGAKRYYEQVTQSNPDTAKLFRIVNGTLAPIVRQMGEKGNLSDTDIKRAKGLFASPWDTPAVAWDMYNELTGIVNRGIQNALSQTETKKPSLGMGGRKSGNTPDGWRGSGRYRINGKEMTLKTVEEFNAALGGK